MNLRVGISGASGTGKSTLAQYISGQHAIPFISTSTKPLWPKYKVNSHEELIMMALKNPQMGMDFQWEVLEYRRKLLTNEAAFVTDRTPVCNVVYFLMQNSFMISEPETRKYIDACNEALKDLFTGIIFLPFNGHIVLENDGNRVNSKYY